MSWYGNDFPYTAQAIALNTPSKSGVYVVLPSSSVGEESLSP